MLMPVNYAQISSTEDQRPTTTNPVQITLNQNDSISGVEHSAKRSFFSDKKGSRLIQEGDFNPKNQDSIDFFTKHGFKHIQNTYECVIE